VAVHVRIAERFRLTVNVAGFGLREEFGRRVALDLANPG
jgi:hypothetical protein